MKLKVLAMISLCFACGNDSADQDGEAVQQAIDQSDAAHDRLCAVADRCYPSLQTADSCVLPATSGTQGTGRAGAGDFACAKPVLDAHPKEAAALFDCVAQVLNAEATCAQDCPEGKPLDECITSAVPRTEGGCSEPLDKVVTREEAAALRACDADGG